MHRSAEVWLIFRLHDGRTFTLPDHPDTQAVSENEETFNAAGLSFECLVPFMSWRIRFNGLLRQGVRSEWSADVKDKELITVKCNFLWSAKSGPLHWPSIESSSPIARSLSSIEKGQLARFTEKGYDQYGAMLGEVFVGSGDAKEQFEINLPGLRQRRWGTIGNGSPYASIIGVFGDGLVFNAREVKGSGSTGTYCGNISFPSGRLEWIDSINFNGKVVEFKGERMIERSRKKVNLPNLIIIFFFSFQLEKNASQCLFPIRSTFLCSERSPVLGSPSAITCHWQ